MDSLSLRCETILKEPLTKDICYDFRKVRSRSMCETWKIFEEKKIPFKEARKLGWEKVKADCAKIGAII
jgi:hypothetical protein